jgi:glucosamine 6-phosphate synthetase-like amidotransferase/phosphosugar isomerase protein
MCGIIAYIGKKNETIGNLLTNAQFNIHRGDEGLGIIYEEGENVSIRKVLYEIDEVINGELGKWRTIKSKRIGSIETTIFDENKYKRMNKKFNKFSKEIRNTESNFIFIHHRKATYGDKVIKNLHPIKINNKYYIHNGTSWGIDAVRNYLEIFKGEEFNSDTDTEVISKLYNKLLDKYENDKDKVYSTFSELVTNGWGVLIEINPINKEVTIIKDELRTLWLYTLKDDSQILVSEPTPFIKNIKSLHKIESGIFTLKDSSLYTRDYTEFAIKSHNWWKDAKDDDIKLKKCEICGTKKYTLSTWECNDHPYKRKNEDRCFECFVENKKKNKEDSDEIKQQNKKEEIAQYIG